MVLGCNCRCENTIRNMNNTRSNSSNGKIQYKQCIVRLIVLRNCIEYHENGQCTCIHCLLERNSVASRCQRLIVQQFTKQFASAHTLIKFPQRIHCLSYVLFSRQLEALSPARTSKLRCCFVLYSNHFGEMRLILK